MQLAELPLQLTGVLPLLPVSGLPGVTLQQQTGITQQLIWPPNTLQRYTAQLTWSLQQPAQPPQQVTWLAQLPTGPLLTANLLLQASSISSSPALSGADRPAVPATCRHAARYHPACSPSGVVLAAMGSMAGSIRPPCCTTTAADRQQRLHQHQAQQLVAPSILLYHDSRLSCYIFNILCTDFYCV